MHMALNCRARRCDDERNYAHMRVRVRHVVAGVVGRRRPIPVAGRRQPSAFEMREFEV